MTDTPRTDAMIIRDCYIEDGYTHHEEWIGDMVCVSFARELEREILNRPMFDYEAIGWALKKVKAYGAHNTEEGAMMADRLEAIIR